MQNLAEVTSISVKLRPGNNNVVIVGAGGPSRLFLAWGGAAIDLQVC